ncbi:MAG: serine/threonine protein kinase [Acidobacteria bacterium]|nr:MAG: serine/threonine protein kinase [Acidobacteriota bacterium]
MKRAIIESFDLVPGRSFARKYEIVSKLGSGWEGEVYKIREKSTGIERAVKLFFPHRNERNKAVTSYARKLHNLRACPMVIQYHTEEMIIVRKQPIRALVSEYVEGELLSDFLTRQRGGRLAPFQALHLLHALAVGLECIHRSREFHGDLHTDNIIVEHYGLSFDLRLLDFFHWTTPKREGYQNDLCEVIRIFYDALGGSRFYRKQPLEIKAIVLGLKRSLILKRYPTTTHLRQHLESLRWE